MINVTVKGNRVYVKTPFNGEVVSAAKRIGGKWDQEHKAWHFDRKDEARVREMLVGIYGTDGTPGPTATVRWTVSDKDTVGNELWAFGRCLIRRRARDADPTVGEGVVVEEGEFDPSGGSVKNPRVGINTLMTILIRDVPLAAARAFVESHDQVAGLVDEAATTAPRKLTAQEQAAVDALRALGPEARARVIQAASEPAEDDVAEAARLARAGLAGSADPEALVHAVQRGLVSTSDAMNSDT